MKNSKLLNILKSLTTTEFEQFVDYVNSPFLNKRKQQIVFINYLQSLFPTFPEKKISKQKLFSRIYPGQVYEDKKIRYEMSYLMQLLEHFLAYQEYDKDSFTKGFYLLENLNTRRQDKYFQQYSKKLKTRLAGDADRNPDYYYRCYRLSDLANQNFLERRERKFDINIQEADHYLDLYYLSQKIRNCCNMADRQKILAQHYQIEHLDEVTKMITASPSYDESDFSIFHKVYKGIDQDFTEAEFRKTLSMLDETADYLNVADQKEIYFYLINHCARKIRNGAEQYVEIALQLYLKAIDSKVIFEKGFLSPWTFKNIVSLGLRSKQYDWVKKFIEEYSGAIKPMFRPDALHFNLADWNFHQKNYRDTLFELNQLEYSDIYYNLNGRVLLLKAYFHLNEINPLLSGIASFSIYLRRNKKITKEVKHSYLNFCNLLFQLIKAGPNKQQAVVKKVNETTQVISKAWLIEIAKNIHKSRFAF